MKYSDIYGPKTKRQILEQYAAESLFVGIMMIAHPVAIAKGLVNMITGNEPETTQRRKEKQYIDAQKMKEITPVVDDYLAENSTPYKSPLEISNNDLVIFFPSIAPGPRENRPVGTLNAFRSKGIRQISLDTEVSEGRNILAIRDGKKLEALVEFETPDKVYFGWLESNGTFAHERWYPNINGEILHLAQALRYLSLDYGRHSSRSFAKLVSDKEVSHIVGVFEDSSKLDPIEYKPRMKEHILLHRDGTPG